MTIDEYPVSARWVDASDDSKGYKNFTDSKVGADWLETHVYISKYCLQIAKCNDLECCKPARTNVQEVLGGKFFACSVSSYWGLPLWLIPKRKSENQKKL